MVGKFENKEKAFRTIRALKEKGLLPYLNVISP
jgi:hypothetical protein